MAPIWVVTERVDVASRLTHPIPTLSIQSVQNIYGGEENASGENL